MARGAAHIVPLSTALRRRDAGRANEVSQGVLPPCIAISWLCRPRLLPSEQVEGRTNLPMTPPATTTSLPFQWPPQERHGVGGGGWCLLLIRGECHDVVEHSRLLHYGRQGV